MYELDWLVYNYKLHRFNDKIKNNILRINSFIYAIFCFLNVFRYICTCTNYDINM